MSRKMQDQVHLWLPDGMREALKVAAAANGRSMNAEIIHRLSTWREPRSGSASTSSISFEVDTANVQEALALVRQLGDAARDAFDAMKKLDIKGDVEVTVCEEGINDPRP